MERPLDKKQEVTKALEINRNKKRKIRKCSEFCPVYAFLR